MELLIVDASRSYGEALRQRLAGAYEIRLCWDGEEALRELNRKTPDVLLLHLALPRKDGLTVLSQVAKRPETVLVMTNFLDLRLTKRLYQDLEVAQILIQPSVNATASWLMGLRERKAGKSSRQRYVQILQDLGVSSAWAGYRQILEALALLEQDPGQKLLEQIYPKVGRGAEKNIRDAISGAYRTGDRQAWEQLFPQGCPTNKRFLHRLLQPDQDRKP